jgi:hypothetical protein
MHHYIAGFLRRHATVSVNDTCGHTQNSMKKTGPQRPLFMPDDSTHRFSNHELHMTQLPQRPKAKPPEFTTP